ncbi:hypothetical protein BpHYR1_002872 [Brachionus plicatilis]|uniref:Uncharacterized protein n=1 Tax=Brachionus plicatilis TaxID=10195 RepID=A0A3M7PE19_BRAPC|nr:hypothetical protein BpHYR1_002872 [Brachionus plicatilis]
MHLLVHFTGSSSQSESSSLKLKEKNYKSMPKYLLKAVAYSQDVQKNYSKIKNKKKFYLMYASNQLDVMYILQCFENF